MSQEPSGSGTAATERSYWRVLGIICLYAAASFAVLPVVGRQGPELPAITSFFVAGLLVTELTTSFLLFARFAEARSWSMLVLGCAYLYSAAMAVCHLLTFPGAVLPLGPVSGTAQSTAWIFDLWFLLYAALTLAAIVLETVAAHRRIAPERVARAIVLSIGLVLAMVLCCLLVATVAEGRMPALIDGASWTMLNDAISVLALLMMAAGIALVLLVVGHRNVLFLWLSLVLTATLCSQSLALAGGARYTVGWSTSRLSWLTSAGVLFLFFMAQFVRQHRALGRARDTLEQRVAARTSDLTLAVKQRDVLLREVYHRVKNNLQIMDALIVLESRDITDEAAQAALAELRNRVFTLALVHQQLMSSRNLESFSIFPFLEALSDNVAASHAAADRGIAVSVVAEPMMVTLDFALPVGLIATELLSNAFKRAGGTAVTVAFRRRSEKTAVLVIGDNGERDGAAGAPGARAGFGVRIVAGFVKQLEGEMGIFHEDGTRVEIEMPLPEAPP